jgi:hypothetical protein
MLNVFAQLNRPEYAAISMLVKKAQSQRDAISGITNKAAASTATTSKVGAAHGKAVETAGASTLEDKQQQQQQQFIREQESTDSSTAVDAAAMAAAARQVRKKEPVIKLSTTPKLKSSTVDADPQAIVVDPALLSPSVQQQEQQRFQREEAEAERERMSRNFQAVEQEERKRFENQQQQQQQQQQHNEQEDDRAADDAGGGDDGLRKSQHTEGKKKRKRKPGPKARGEEQQPEQQQEPSMSENSGGGASDRDVMAQQLGKEALMKTLYGDGKAYPEPYAAGKIPNQQLHDRYRLRFNRETFLYSIRYRNGPFGLAFDNRIPDATMVEKVMKGEQSELSDVKVGDRLVAIDEHNVSSAPAKITQRILNSLPWPRILVFESRNTQLDPKEVEARIRARTYNMSVLYPPSLTTQFQMRVAEWTPQRSIASLLDEEQEEEVGGDGGGEHTNNNNNDGKDNSAAARRATGNGQQVCPLFVLRTPAEPFGCTVQENEFDSYAAMQDVINKQGIVDEEVLDDA